MEIVRDIKLHKDTTIRGLVDQFSEAGGFTAKKLAIGANIFKKMQQEKCIKFLSFPSCLVATGTRGVLKDLVKNKKVNVIITTAGTLALDVLRTIRDFYAGDFELDDTDLKRKGYFRIGSILIKEKDYGPAFEEFFQPVLETLYKGGYKSYSSRALVWLLGEVLSNNKKAEESILYWAWKNKIPVYVPGITDGLFGSQLWLFWQQHKDIKIDLMQDENELSEIVHHNKKSGALCLGGGISKHHTLWWAQFSEGLDYAIYITTAMEYDGSLSGARTREAISWGKINERAKHITIEGDATVILPLLVAAVKE